MGFAVTTKVPAALAGGWQQLSMAERVTAWLAALGEGCLRVGVSGKAATV